MKPKILERFKKFNMTSWFLMIGGLALFILGVYRKLYYPAEPGYNIGTQQPLMIDGTMRMIVGFGLLIIGLYRLVYRNKVFEDKLKIEREIKEEEENQIRIRKGCKK